jgi:very-short-patch-repair endonuclease
LSVEWENEGLRTGRGTEVMLSGNENNSNNKTIEQNNNRDSVEVKTQRFIEKARLVHGDRYGYEEVVFINRRDKVKIRCKEHGVFEQEPARHLKNTNCPTCALKELKLTNEIFIKRAKEKHGDKYDYSVTEYKGVKEKVKIKCPTHGVFEQRPDGHLFGYGCRECSERAPITLEKFSERAKATHGDRYDYSLIKEIIPNAKVKIICKEHGIFEQKIGPHTDGANCISCTHNKRPTMEEIIKQGKEKYGDKFDYSLSVYIDNNTKMKIICTKHGVFEQRVDAHLSGHTGCKACYLGTAEEVIEKFKKVHGGRYDYSLVVNLGTHKKVKIICKEHGVFEQTPFSHDNDGQGCPDCALGKNEKYTKCFLNEILGHKTKIEPQKPFKIENNPNFKKVRVDFYFILNGKEYIVEYNGKQHFQPVPFGSTTQQEAEIAFERQKIRDEYLRNYCKEKGIILIEIDGRKYINLKIKKYLLEKFPTETI